MNAAQFSTGIGKLRGAMELLQASWTQARLDWADDAASNFEELHFEPIVRELGQILEATMPLVDCLSQACRECGEENR